MHTKLFTSVRRTVRLAFVFLLLSQTLVAPAAKEAAPAQSPLTLARAAEKDIPAENTKYRHEPTTVTWKGIDGATENTCFADCSGFLNEVLKHAYNIDDAALANWLGSRRPVARLYHDAIVEEKGFNQITHIKDIKPGDIAAIKFPPGGTVTGHVMIVNAKPTPRKPTAPLLADSKQWNLEIIDSTSKPHIPDDSRAGAEKHTGLGHGVIRLYGDKDGRIIGYSWSTAENSPVVMPEDRHFVVGRLTGPPKIAEVRGEKGGQ
ncbi:hypothetical protein BH09SUM1_BH09SUM1_10320 [soil metagenome]